MSTPTQNVLSFSSIQERASKPAVAPAGIRSRVLVVDDSEDLRELIATVLRVQFHLDTVAQAGNGVEAVERVAALQPDLVLMDVQMPGLDGINACRIISSSYPQTAVILMSGDDSPQLRAQALACGARSFIYKPKFAAEVASVLSSGEHDRVRAGA
jgi:CheY-like chemotaxis protein